MNYFPFHIGDYAVHTRHLSLMEDLAYRRLLDLYYTREKPLPVAVEEVARLVGMREQAAEVGAVLCEFFGQDEEGWFHERCDEEIASMSAKKALQEAKEVHEAERLRRHRERRAEMFAALRAVGQVPAWDVAMKELQSLFDTHCNVPATHLQRVQTESATAISTNTNTSIKEREPRATRLPTPWSCPDEWLSWAKSERPDLNPDRTAQKFADYWHGKPGKDGRKLDWLATWRNWVRDERAERFNPADIARVTVPSKPSNGYLSQLSKEKPKTPEEIERNRQAKDAAIASAKTSLSRQAA